MKQKYTIAVKFYTETKNEIQLDFAYKEIESFLENYTKFKIIFKENYEKVVNKYSSLLGLNQNLHQILKSKNKEYDSFLFYLNRYKYKIADNIFQQGNYNIELVKHAIDKVLKKEKTNQNKLLLKDILKGGITKETKIKGYSQLSFLFYFSLILLSFAFIIIHCYMYVKNPTKISNSFK